MQRTTTTSADAFAAIATGIESSDHYERDNCPTTGAAYTHCTCDTCTTYTHCERIYVTPQPTYADHEPASLDNLDAVAATERTLAAYGF